MLLLLEGRTVKGEAVTVKVLLGAASTNRDQVINSSSCRLWVHIVDTNHCNSGKKHLEQPRIVKEVLSSRKYNDSIRKLVKGFMIESYIEDGNQKVDEHIYGKSITDPCLGWEKTEKMILEIADRV